jgi:hypothetical protein
MGNQMFQYAFGRVLSIKNNTDLLFNIEAYENKSKRPFAPNFAIRDYDLDVFNIKGRVAKNNEIPFMYRMYFKGSLMTLIDAVRRRIFKHKAQELYAQRFNPKMLLLGKNSYIDGFFQSPKYFLGYEDILRKDFKLKNKPDKNIENLYKEISNCDALCIHVRRGDFVGNKEHEIVGMEYYQKALNILESRVPIYRIYIFSDDIDWCKNNMVFKYPTFFVDNSFSGLKGEGHMYLMSACKNFIIPNSTFSWWGVWLSDNKDKQVVAPRVWSKDQNADMGDIILDEWITI